jgi:hypothetical protein
VGWHEKGPGEEDVQLVRVTDEDLMFKSLSDDPAREDEVVESEGSRPGAGDCWIFVSGLDRGSSIDVKVSRSFRMRRICRLCNEGRE